jgi:hypothetical protein
MEMLGRMFVLGGIAATHMAALQAQPQMYPGISKFDALRADVCLGVGDFDLVEMSTVFCHIVLSRSLQRSKALRSHFANVAAAS